MEVHIPVRAKSEEFGESPDELVATPGAELVRGLALLGARGWQKSLSQVFHAVGTLLKEIPGPGSRCSIADPEAAPPTPQFRRQGSSDPTNPAPDSESCFFPAFDMKLLRATHLSTLLITASPTLLTRSLIPLRSLAA